MRSKALPVLRAACTERGCVEDQPQQLGIIYLGARISTRFERCCGWLSAQPRSGKTSVGVSQHAFTLIELLVVIGIMAILAGLIVGLSAVTGDRNRRTVANGQLHRLGTLIETYKAKKGYYPPDNPGNFNDPTNTSLFYELIGAVPNGSRFDNPALGVSVERADLQTACGVGGVVNSSAGTTPEDAADVLHLLTTVKSTETNTIEVNGSKIIVFVGPQGPDGRIVNPFHYRIGSPTNNAHNPQGYDLWVDVKARGGSATIGNWKE